MNLDEKRETQRKEIEEIIKEVAQKLLCCYRLSCTGELRCEDESKCDLNLRFPEYTNEENENEKTKYTNEEKTKKKAIRISEQESKFLFSIGFGDPKSPFKVAVEVPTDEKFFSKDPDEKIIEDSDKVNKKGREQSKHLALTKTEDPADDPNTPKRSARYDMVICDKNPDNDKDPDNKKLKWVIELKSGKKSVVNDFIKMVTANYNCIFFHTLENSGKDTIKYLWKDFEMAWKMGWIEWEKWKSKIKKGGPAISQNNNYWIWVIVVLGGTPEKKPNFYKAVFKSDKSTEFPKYEEMGKYKENGEAIIYTCRLPYPCKL